MSLVNKKPNTSGLLACKGKGRPDNFQTPQYAIKDLLKYLPELTGKVWEPCMGKGNIIRAFADFGVDAIGTDVESGVDFLTTDFDEYDYIITNPPYSLKDEFLTRCYESGKPFALLLPLTALEGKRIRMPLYREHGVEVIMPNGRINFGTPSGKGSGSHFFTAWFTHGFNLGSPLTFMEGED